MAIGITGIVYKDRNTVEPDPRIDPATTFGVQPVGQTGWTLTDSEEFNGSITVTDAPNGLINFRTGGPTWATWYPNWQMFADDSPTAANHSNTGYESYYVTSKVSLSSGALQLVCDKQTTLAGYDYTAGMITTVPATRSFQYGYFEVKARISGGGSGNWPAFWSTSAATNTWNSEIDIWESFNSSTYKTNVYTGSWVENSLTFDQSAYHTYASKWTSSGVTFYRDGIQTYTTANHPTEPHYLLLNNGAQTSGSPTFTQSLLEVDYVRVWQ